MRNKKALLLTGTLALLLPSTIGTFALIKYTNSSKITPNEMEDKDKTPSFSDKEVEPNTNENTTPSNVENSDNTPKELSKQEQELELAPNLIPFVKKYNKEHSDAPISDIKQLVDIINTLNTNDNEEDNINIENWSDFEKQYLNLYNSINNFFKEELKYRYKLANFSFDVVEDKQNLNNPSGASDEIYTVVSPKVEESRLNEKQLLYHKLFSIFKDDFEKLKNTGFLNSWLNDSDAGFKENESLNEKVKPLIDDKIKEFNSKQSNFVFFNNSLKYFTIKHSSGTRVFVKTLIQSTLNIKYQNDKLPEILNLPLIFKIDNETDLYESIESENLRMLYIEERKQDRERTSSNSNVRWETERFETYQEWKEFMHSERSRESFWWDTQWKLRHTIFRFDDNDDSYNSDESVYKHSEDREGIEVKDVY